MREAPSIFTVNCVNLAHRTDRRNHIIEEFKGKYEFNLEIVPAIQHKKGAIGLWKTINELIAEALNSNQEYIIICEDDHSFPLNYTREILFDAIQLAGQMETDILLGGISWFNNALQISPNLFWVDKFSGLQFTIVYRKFFETILKADFNYDDAADYKISSLTSNKLIIYPFISTQKEFGYSDVTSKNNTEGYVTKIFNDAAEQMGNLQKAAQFYEIEF